MQVLRWYGYFKETVPESPRETYRVRRVVFRYYLVDDTMDVEEPRQLNSGIDQVNPPRLRTSILLMMIRACLESQCLWMGPINATASSRLYTISAKNLHTMQGILLKRHRIPGPSGCPLAPKDMQIGQNLTVYGRTYFISAVDGFTRQYLSQRGICLAPDEEVPACPNDAWLAKHNMPGWAHTWTSVLTRARSAILSLHPQL